MSSVSPLTNIIHMWFLEFSPEPGLSWQTPYELVDVFLFYIIMRDELLTFGKQHILILLSLFSLTSTQSKSFSF